jgi:CheY-like chemotaxis protein
MLDQEDLKWIASTSTELNSLLQQIALYADLARQHKGEYNYIELLGERVEMASKASQSLFDRITSRILASARDGRSSRQGDRAPNFAVVPSPAGEEKTSAPRRSSTSTKKIPVGEMKSGSRKKIDVSIKNPNGNRELILLVDDEPEISELAAEMLAEEGYKMILAKDGFEALRIYEQMGKRIGLVIVDFFLPIMDGDAVFDELKAINPNINVVFSSGFAEQSKLASMLARGLRGFIPKPYTREKLLEQVGSIIESAREQAH